MKIPNGIWLTSESLKSRHTFKIETFADIFYIPGSQDDACQVLQRAYEESVPVFILGSGTNLLIGDKGIRGLVLYQGPLGLNSSPRVKRLSNEFYEVEVSSRMSKADLLQFSVDNKFTGLEFSAGIPGTLGGAVWMNAGTKWGSYRDVIGRVLVYHPQRGRKWLSVDELGLTYRSHNEDLFDSWFLIHSVVLKLKKYFSVDDQQESLKKINDILLYRGTRQPLQLPNCGSVFKNPVDSQRGAGRLIEASQLKGKIVGDACVSLQHANFIHNRGKATATDVRGLIQTIQAVVQKSHGIKLETEVLFKGDF